MSAFAVGEEAAATALGGVDLPQLEPFVGPLASCLLVQVGGSVLFFANGQALFWGTGAATGAPSIGVGASALGLRSPPAASWGGSCSSSRTRTATCSGSGRGGAGHAAVDLVTNAHARRARGVARGQQRLGRVQPGYVVLTSTSAGLVIATQTSLSSGGSIDASWTGVTLSGTPAVFLQFFYGQFDIDTDPTADLESPEIGASNIQLSADSTTVTAALALSLSGQVNYASTAYGGGGPVPATGQNTVATYLIVGVVD
ncbi:MAG TPA: hypothetical protein VHN14_18510 [Kofleriaceae bacterium]|nr:hypothetical protein [Kofleriaceae bacterium]